MHHISCLITFDSFFVVHFCKKAKAFLFNFCNLINRTGNYCMHEAQLQEYLFQRVKEKLPATTSLADAVAETLFISNDSAYRRIRGETPLVLEEARTLCNRFSISFDEVLHSKS